MPSNTTSASSRMFSIASTASSEIRHTEQSVLYLEALLDRVKMKDLKELADQLMAEISSNKKAE